MRIGHGYDVHKFSGEGPIRLGGIDIPHNQGLLAHSDGDVLLHSLCDAILGALGEGDIGHWFPDTDSQYENIDSCQLLMKVIRLMKEKKYRVSNADITVIAQAPKMAPHIEAMKLKIAGICEVKAGTINVKATTTEGLGFTGRGEGIAVHAVVLLQKKLQPNRI